ncbi:MAG: hypothetical protein KF734_01740 [Saprospiraceae bacterium]|nr:hypothetical protein [Saprospiraceae bacterium]
MGKNFFWKLAGILVVSAVLLAMLTVYGEKWLSKSENNIKPASKNFEPEIRVEEKKATAQSSKSEAKTESNNGLPAWMWRKLPEWLQWILAKNGFIEAHHPWKPALYLFTKEREMFQKHSLDGWINYIQVKIADGEREKDESSKLEYFRLA